MVLALWETRVLFITQTFEYFEELKKTTFRPVLACFVQRAFAEFSYKDVMLEALFDRLCVRCETFKRPVAEALIAIFGAEKWNLRALPRTLPGGTKDILFGGWTNLIIGNRSLCVCFLPTRKRVRQLRFL